MARHNIQFENDELWAEVRRCASARSWTIARATREALQAWVQAEGGSLSDPSKPPIFHIPKDPIERDELIDRLLQKGDTAMKNGKIPSKDVLGYLEVLGVSMRKLRT